jgi:hypothetical protein
MKMIISLMMTFALGLPSHSAKMQKGTVKLTSKEEIRTTIKEILQATFERAVYRKPDGTAESVSLVLLHATDENRQRVRHFGNAAISVLQEYVADSEGWRQQLASELLGEFKSDEALAALVDFAEHAKVRDIAVHQMAQYPIDKTRPILKSFLSDPDPLVRDAARRALASYGEK